MTMCFEAYVNLSRALSIKHLNTRYNSNSLPDKCQVISHPPNMSQTPYISKFASHEGIINWEVFVACFATSQRSLGEDRNWRGEVAFLTTEQESVRFTLWTGNEVAALPPTSSSCGLHLLTSPWRSSPSPRHLVGPGAIYQRGVIQEKTNLLIRFINLSRLTLRQGSWFNTSCSEVSCWWAEGWGQSAGRK